jgi:type I restriction enzyme S subunit
MTRVCLGDVAREIKQKVPVDQELPTVGLEHLDPGEVELAHWDEGVETTFTKAFSKGQVLFGRRRAYLRKAAVAPFDGICSGDITVIAPKDNLSPRLLPFIIQNDALFEHAITNSAGSLSPRVKWQSLSQFEFELPSIAKQEDLADILWTAQETRSHYRQLLTACDDVVKSQFVEMFGGPDPTESDCLPVTIGELAADIRYGTSKKASDSGEFKYLRMNNMTDDGRLDLSDLKYIDLSGAELENAKVVRGDLLFNRTNSREKVGKTCVFNKNEPMVIAGYIVRVRFDERVEPGYVSAFLNSSYGKGLLRKMAKGAVGQANISAKEMAKIELPLPPIELQRSFLDFAASVDKSKFAVQKALDELNATTKKILNQELGLGDV